MGFEKSVFGCCENITMPASAIFRLLSGNLQPSDLMPAPKKWLRIDLIVPHDRA
jgi:hypothetical protein